VISALYVRRNSVYKTLGLDCWDIDRDARNWPGGNPLIAHPPCAQWGRLHGQAKKSPEQKKLAIDAVGHVRKWGGVLEHPAHSALWREQHLPIPGGGIDLYGGWSLSVDQSWWGHKARKGTWLYIVGIEPKRIPPFRISFDAIQFVVCTSRGRKGMRAIPKSEREKTPIDFAKWLIDLAKCCSFGLAET